MADDNLVIVDQFYNNAYPQDIVWNGFQVTQEQERLMIYLDQIGGWTTLFELSDTSHLAVDDDLFVPSLVARGWVDHDSIGQAVRITADGRSALEDSVLPKRS